ncbi:DUF6973 domain-containing protein [Solicola gregarius]|uniref:DUF6973 domain-containing protein n=1 Tax=Solicola gregarius TaxID=2908642 RepID=A0AA46TLL9_9ACTN|nr:hypothetical protein [Solicola gregarius]UYM07187.1 hypothetical protein L0C25_08955 [Solicola gregarius]
MTGPPFERYPVASATIRGNADTVGNSSKPLVAVKNAMDGPRQRAADAVDGTLDGAIAGPTDPAQRDALTTAKGADVCSGAIELYADYVDIFNYAVDDLNERWAAAKERDFDVPMGGSAEEHDGDVAEAKGKYAQELRVEFGKAEKALDDGAGDVARVLNAGPDDGAVLLANYGASTAIVIAMNKIFSGGPITLADIEKEYQVEDDPDGLVNIPGVGTVTASEAWMLGNLGILALLDMKDIKEDAFSTADDRFTPEDQNDNHNDAFRHAYWNALMTRRFGEDWTEDYTNAHEGIPGNNSLREAMDLYNNGVGRRIASENPDASDEEIANLIEEAVRNGDMVVIGPDGHLVWSNTIEEGGETADSDNLPNPPQDGNPDNDPDSNADPDSHNEHGSGS